MVADNFERFGPNDMLKGSTMIDRRSDTYLFCVDTTSFLRGNVMFSRGENLGYIKPMFRASFIKNNGIRHIEDIFIGEDFHFCLTCLLQGARFVVTSESFYKYRTRAGSLSWRLEADHIHRLLRAYDELGLECRFSDNEELKDAAVSYAEALRRAAVAATVIDEAKSHHWQRAMRLGAVHPEAWTLLLRFGSEAVWKRIIGSR
jgi:hypothetical protein